MLQISKTQREALDHVGLIKYKKPGVDPNLVILNRQHKSRDKSYYIAEDRDVLLFLEQYESLNLQKIYPNQLNALKKENLITEDQIQRPNEYKKNAIAFIAKDGTIRLFKVAKLMLFLGIWKQNKK